MRTPLPQYAMSGYGGYNAVAGTDARNKWFAGRHDLLRSSTLDAGPECRRLLARR
jgi:hypothetical protein